MAPQIQPASSQSVETSPCATGVGQPSVIVAIDDVRPMSTVKPGTESIRVSPPVPASAR